MTRSRLNISQSQLKAVRSLICERLSSCDDNLRDIGCFSNPKGESIVNTLKGEAFDEDQSGAKAYYLIKSSEGDILFFFSLQCGSLYDKPINDKELEILKKYFDYLESLQKKSSLSEEQSFILSTIKEKVRTRKRIVKDDFNKLPHGGFDLWKDIEKENNNVSRVISTFPGIELVHFCSNKDLASQWIERNKMPRTIGEIVFWFKIIPIILDVKKIIGCEYLFLFAADSSEDLHLVNYYEDSLKFHVPNDIGIAKPFYDLTCSFMVQEISSLKENLYSFKKRFNERVPGPNKV